MRRLLAIVGIVAFSVMFAISVVGPLLSRLAEEDGIPLGPRPNTSIGLVFALGGLTLALFQVPFARMADRVGRKLFIVSGSMAVGVFILALGYSKALASVLGIEDLRGPMGWRGSTLLLAFFRALQGAAAAATWPVLMSVLAACVPEDRMGAAMGVFGASFGLGMSLGPVAGPALASAAGIHSSFILAFILALAAGSTATMLPEIRGSGHRERGEVEAGTRDPRLVALSLLAFSLLFCMGALVVIYPRYMEDELGLGMRDVALAMALASLTYTFLQPLAGRVADMADKRMLASIGLLAAATAVAAAGQASGRTAIYVSMTVFGVAGAFAFPASNALVGLIAPEGREGSYTGLYNAMLSMGVTLSPIVVGFSADTVGYAAAFAVPLIVALISVIIFAWVFGRRALI